MESIFLYFKITIFYFFLFQRCSLFDSLWIKLQSLLSLNSPAEKTNIVKICCFRLNGKWRNSFTNAQPILPTAFILIGSNTSEFRFRLGIRLVRRGLQKWFITQWKKAGYRIPLIAMQSQWLLNRLLASSFYRTHAALSRNAYSPCFLRTFILFTKFDFDIPSFFNTPFQSNAFSREKKHIQTENYNIAIVDRFNSLDIYQGNWLSKTISSSTIWPFIITFFRSHCYRHYMFPVFQITLHLFANAWN